MQENTKQLYKYEGNMPRCSVGIDYAMEGSNDESVVGRLVVGRDILYSGGARTVLREANLNQTLGLFQDETISEK